MDEAETPHDDKPADKSGGGAAALVTEAESAGKLQVLDDLMAEMGWDETSGTLLLLAQKDARTRGKSPDELAEMLRQDPVLYDDLEAYKPGGSLENHADKDPSAPADEPADEEDDGEPIAEMGEYVEKSGSFKDADPKQAKKAMKDAGASRPSDLDADYDAKKNFLKNMAG